MDHNHLRSLPSVHQAHAHTASRGHGDQNSPHHKKMTTQTAQVKWSFRLQSWCITLLAGAIVTLLSVGCGGEISVTTPGCEQCTGPCVQLDNGRGRCVDCIADKDCRSEDSTTKKCIGNKCYCGTDTDCPKGQRCAGQNGCVECLRDSHCEDKEKPFCGPDNRCAACQPKSSRACVPKGSNACVKGTQVCRNNGQWDVCTGAKSCESNQKCVDSKCVLDCPPAPCEATENKCTSSSAVLPGTFLRCIKNEKGCLEWSAEERKCGDKEYCDKGQCIPFACPPAPCKLDQTRCVGDGSIRRCERTAKGCLDWGDKEACPGKTKCREALARCTACIPKAVRDCYSGPQNTQNQGDCKAGKSTCADDGSGFGTCVGESLPKKELCNGKDDNCDGSIDETFADKGKTCSIGKGECQQSGTFICQADGLNTTCDAKLGQPSKETCDNKDNDCDGNIDENLTQSCYIGPPNTAGKGICQNGTQSCTAGVWGACTGAVTPKTETCNNKDDDCDGAIDQSLSRSCYSGSTSSKGKGECKEGRETCTAGVWGACIGEITPKTETCNNKDDNCDGNIDENLTKSCYSGPVGTSQLGTCKAGKQTCQTGQWGNCVGEITPKTETCNNQDDNCDGVIDNNVTRSCYTGPAITKGVGRCKDGTQVCLTGNWGTCQNQVLPAASEICPNSIDDDCNGQVDDCAAVYAEIRSSINTDTGAIDGVPSTGWKGNGRFELGAIRIPLNARVRVTGSKPLILVITGDAIIEGMLLLGGRQGGSSNCSTAGAGAGGAGGGGGGAKGGDGGGCNVSGVQPKGSNGSGASPGLGGSGGSSNGGGGGGAGHANTGGDGVPTGLGGKGGLPNGTATSVSPGSGGGGGACGVQGSGILGIYTPAAGGGGGGGSITLDATGNITISGSVLAGGGSGGHAPKCGFGGFGFATGGGGGGGAGGAIRIRAKQQLTLQSTAFINATGGTGGGEATAKGGAGSPGYIRFEDANGAVTIPTGRVAPTPSIASY